MALILLVAWVCTPATVTPLAVAREPEARHAGASGWERRGGPPVGELPVRWLRYSRDSFQWMMHLLAERSSRMHRPFVSEPATPAAERPEPDWPSAAPGGQEPGKPEPDGHDPDGYAPDRPWPAEPPAERVERRRTAEAERDHPRTRARHWHKTWSHSCRRAGRPAKGSGWYVVAPGDTLQHIAWLHYGDQGAWRRIRHVNRGTISDPDLIHACQRLFIPRRYTDQPRCEEPPIEPIRPTCDRAPPPVDRGPGGCSRCGAGPHVGEWGWR